MTASTTDNLDQLEQAFDTSPVRGVLAKFFGADPIALPTVTKLFDGWAHINLQAALDAYGDVAGRSVELVGAAVPPAGGGSPFPPSPPVLTQLVTVPTARLGSVDRLDLACGPDKELACISQGLVLVNDADRKVAIWVREDSLLFGRKIAIDVMALSVNDARDCIAELDVLRQKHNLFRGQLVRFDADNYGNVRVDFDERPNLQRDQLILPEALLSAIEGHAIGIAECADDLHADARHVKRGLLLYGPPGTGKTLTIRYLASQLTDATLFVLTGTAMAWLKFVVQMAGDIGPSVIVLDDVDLIAEDRNLGGMSPRRHLFDLLDAMDGVHENNDVLFVATTNRVESLEKAISARPGRIDQAVQVPLPDADCRLRLMHLYGRGLDLQMSDADAVLQRTDGVTASFVKELMRRAAVIAVRTGEDAGDEAAITVTDAHLSAALDALLDPLNPLTATLLGGDKKEAFDHAGRGSIQDKDL